MGMFCQKLSKPLRTVGGSDLPAQGPSLVIPSRFLRLIGSCITQLKAQGPSRTCNESKEEEEEELRVRRAHAGPFGGCPDPVLGAIATFLELFLWEFIAKS